MTRGRNMLAHEQRSLQPGLVPEALRFRRHFVVEAWHRRVYIFFWADSGMQRRLTVAIPRGHGRERLPGR